MKRSGDPLESKNVKKKKSGRNKVKFNWQDADSLCRVAQRGCRIVSEGGWEGCRATYGLNEGRGYFEVTIVRGLVRVGFSTEDAKKEVGTDANSFGFGGTGKKSWRRKFEDYGESFKEGDTIGCYLDFEENTISFSKNGEWLDVAYDLPKTMSGETLFPAITIQCGEAKANFGAKEWAFPPELGFPGFEKASNLIAHSLREEDKTYTHVGDITDMKIDLKSEEAKKRAERRRARFAKHMPPALRGSTSRKKPDLNMSLGSLATESKPDLSMSLDSLTSDKKPDLDMSLDSLAAPPKAKKPAPAAKPKLNMSLDSLTAKPKKTVGKRTSKSKAKPAASFKSVVEEKVFSVGDPVECRFTQRFRPARVLEVHRKCDMVVAYTVEYLKSKAVFRESSTRVRSKQGNWNFEMPKVEKIEWKDREKAKVKGESEALEKKYVRSEANPEAQNVRSVEACKKAFTHLKNVWNEKHNYDFIRDQFKSLRQDLKVQHVTDLLTVQVYETNARICLEVRDFSEFNQCQTQLNVLYRQLPELNQNQEEFLAYRLLYLLAIKNFSELKLSLGRCIGSENPLVSTAMKICVALRSANHLEFFRTFEKLNPLAQAILQDSQSDFRFLTLQKMSKGYGPSGVPIGMMKTLLGFDTEGQARKYCAAAGCSIVGGNLECKDSTPLTKPSQLSANVGGVLHALI